MFRHDVEELVALNDPALEALIRASDDEDVEREIEQLVIAKAKTLIENILSRFSRPRTGVELRDVEDIAATIHLRLVEKLRRARSIREEAVSNFEKYVATLAYNAANDDLRRRFPERARLKNRLRYTLTHDSRLARWNVGTTVVCGLAEWEGRDMSDELRIPSSNITRTMRDRDRPADALVAIFRAAGEPVEYDALVAFTAALWHVVDVMPLQLEIDGPVQHGSSVASRFEAQEYMRELWKEIRALRPAQREALLLNLRDDETVNVAALLVRTGVATFDELAAALQMTPEDLAEIWNSLPLDDLRIAERLGVTRQQVINLRKAARKRLHRRLPR